MEICYIGTNEETTAVGIYYIIFYITTAAEKLFICSKEKKEMHIVSTLI